MIFVSGTPKSDMLVIRDIPAILAPIMAVVAMSVFAAAYAADQNGEFTTTLVFFTIGVVVAGLSLALIRARTLTLCRSEATLTISDRWCFRRRRQVHPLKDGAQAEIVITKGDENDDIYQACVASGDDVIELDYAQSFLTPSVRTVRAINAWMHST